MPTGPINITSKNRITIIVVLPIAVGGTGRQRRLLCNLQDNCSKWPPQSCRALVQKREFNPRQEVSQGNPDLIRPDFIGWCWDLAAGQLRESGTTSCWVQSRSLHGQHD